VPTTLLRLVLLAPLLLGGTAATEPLVVAVIVHPSRAETPTLVQIKRIFRREQRFWSDRTPILPVNQEYGSAIRQRFQERIFGGAAADLARHWDEQYFHGILPPATLASDAAVRDYVAARPAAIGYVDVRHVDESVRVVARLD